MPSSPTSTSAVFRPDLRGAVQEEWDTTQEMATMVADEILPLADVEHAAATYRKIGREQYTKDDDDTRAENGGFQRTGYGSDEASYSTVERALEIPVDASAAAREAPYFDAEMVSTRIILSKLKRAHEKRVSAKLFNTSTFAGHTGAVGTAWSNVISSTPIDDIKDAVLDIGKACGLPASMIKLTVNPAVFKNLSESSQILARVSGGSTTEMSARVLSANIAELTGIAGVIVAGGLKDSTAKGQDYVGDYIWGGAFALLSAIRPNPHLLTLQLGATWHWTGHRSAKDFLIESYFSDAVDGIIIRGRRHVGIDVQAPECGLLFTNVT